MALTNDDRLILLGLKEAPIATFKIGVPVTSDVIAKLYSNGLLEFEGAGDIVKFSNYSTPWHNYKSNITSISFKDGNTIQPTSTAYLFQNLNKVTSIDLSNLDTSNVIDMSKMFSTCSSLTEIIGLEDLDTSNVTDVSMMFEYCPSLISLDLSNFDMPKVTTTDFMFLACSNLSSSITIKNSNITSYSGMFAGCSTEPGSEFVVKYIDNDTKSIAEAMVATKYPENSNVVLYVKSAYLINGDDFSIAAMSLTDNISSIQFSNEPPIDPTPGDILIVSESTSPVKAYMAQLATGGIIVYPEEAGYPLVANESCARMFSFMPTSISFDNFDTSKVTDMSYMFNSCDGLTSLDLSKFNTSKVTNMEGMFNSCLSLDTITGLENLNTSNVTNMMYMFRDCGSLNSLDLSSFNTSNVTNMNSMFQNCELLISLDLSGWNTSKVTDMSDMFSGCIQLNSLDLSSFDTSNVEDMAYMFESCRSLESLDLSSFNTSNVEDMSYMFNSCLHLLSFIIIRNPNIYCASMCAGCGRNGTFVIHYITGCETIAQDMVNTKGTGLLAGRTYLGFNIDLITKDSSVSTEITPKIINIIADCAMKQWGYNNTLTSIKSIKITYNDQTNLKWSLTYVSDPCEFVYDYTTKTYTCKQEPSPINII